MSALRLAILRVESYSHKLKARLNKLNDIRFIDKAIKILCLQDLLIIKFSVK